MSFGPSRFNKNIEPLIFYKHFMKSPENDHFTKEGYTSGYISRMARPIDLKFFVDIYLDELFYLQ
jgi:hypothetical protein